MGPDSVKAIYKAFPLCKLSYGIEMTGRREESINKFHANATPFYLSAVDNGGAPYPWKSGGSPLCIPQRGSQWACTGRSSVLCGAHSAPAERILLLAGRLSWAGHKTQ